MSKKAKNPEVETEIVAPIEGALVAAFDAEVAAGTITERPTLKAIAGVLDISPNRLYNVAKQPKAGEIYDARVYNWDAIERFVLKRLPEGQSLDEFVAEVIKKDAELKATDRRVGRRLSDEEKYIKTTGGLMPRRKFALEVGQKVLTKKDRNDVFEVVYLTDTHVVLQKEGTSELKVFANWTANSQMIPPVRFESTFEARKAEGCYDAPAATEEAAE